jgi:hypothetical protein
MIILLPPQASSPLLIVLVHDHRPSRLILPIPNPTSQASRPGRLMLLDLHVQTCWVAKYQFILHTLYLSSLCANPFWDHSLSPSRTACRVTCKLTQQTLPSTCRVAVAGAKPGHGRRRHPPLRSFERYLPKRMLGGKTTGSVSKQSNHYAHWYVLILASPCHRQPLIITTESV